MKIGLDKSQPSMLYYNQDKRKGERKMAVKFDKAQDTKKKKRFKKISCW